MLTARAAALSAVAMALGACSFTPAYQPPSPPTVANYKEGGLWTQATPQDQLPRGGWWRVFADPTLDQLEKSVDASNPTLAQALARYDGANAYLQVAQAGLAPRVSANASVSRNRQSDNRPLRGANQPDEYAADSLGVQIDYELDLWGRVRNAVASQKANAQAAAADLESVKLSLESTLADNYVQLRGLDAQADLLDQAIAAWTRTLELTERRHADGLSSKLDVDRAQTQLEQTKAQLGETGSRRALLEHAIASLVGETASTFTLPPNPALMATPNTPPTVPSLLIQRRPDIAAAERRMAAANFDIGVARAAFFPSISLSGIAGYQNTGGAGLLTAPNSYWGIGPNALLTLFDAGRRRAQAAIARAAFDETSAAYRSRVLQAFQEVEDSLSLENRLAAEAVDEDAAITAAREGEALATTQYRKGLVSYLSVVIAQTTALQAEQSGLDLTVRRSQASIHLIRAIGGGWRETDPSPDQTSLHSRSKME